MLFRFRGADSFKFVSRSVSPKDLDTYIIPANNSAKHGFSMQFSFSMLDLYPSILIKLGKVFILQDRSCLIPLWHRKRNEKMVWRHQTSN